MEALFAEEVVEERLTNLGFHLERKITQDVKCNGGMIVFDVGFGKTVISIFLA